MLNWPVDTLPISTPLPDAAPAHTSTPSFPSGCCSSPHFMSLSSLTEDGTYFYDALRGEVHYWGNRYQNVNLPVPSGIANLFEPLQSQEANFHKSLQQILKYLDDLKKDGEIWGSHECLLAVVVMKLPST